MITINKALMIYNYDCYWSILIDVRTRRKYSVYVYLLYKYAFLP